MTITEDRALEEQIRSCLLQRQNLEAIFDSVGDAIFSADLQLRIIQLNRAAAELTGLARLDAAGVSLLEALGLDPADDALARLLAERREAGGISVRLRSHRGGADHAVLATTRVLRDEGGRERGIVLVLRDVTELEDMRDRLVGDRTFHGLVGRHRSMREIYDLVEQLGDSDATVLILGESGTGKELVAAAVHGASQRRDGPFVKVNCAALSEGLLESELFGHVKGAFTGALRDKIGRFEQASGGTIFLDEIGDLSEQVQVRLLRVLQEREIERVGSGQTIAVDSRVVAATHRDLRAAIAAGTFREDLFYRLNVMPITVPALRDRADDIPLLVDHFIDRFRARTGRPIRYVNDDALQVLTRHRWPGNVRELENAIEHAFIRCRGEVLMADCLPPLQETPSAPPTAPISPSSTPSAADEREAIAAALEAARWNRAEAARSLGMHRTTLWRKMRELGL